jgi:hypothetical protein
MERPRQTTNQQISRALRFIVNLLKDCGLDAIRTQAAQSFIMSILHNHVIMSKNLYAFQPFGSIQRLDLRLS